MKIKISLIIIFLSASANLYSEEITLSTSAAGPAALTLRDCYNMALQADPSIAARTEAVNESKARYKQALGTILPNVFFSAELLRQSTDNNSQLPAYLAAQDSEQLKFGLVQPLFSGFREFSAMSAEKAEIRQRTLEDLRARQALFANVSDAFYSAAEQVETLKIFEGMNDILQKRLGELKERESVGRSRKSDVSSTMVLFYQNNAAVESVKNELATASLQLGYLTGSDGISSLADIEPQAGLDEREEMFREKAGSRADVKAAEEASLIARKQVSFAKASFWPSINLTADYYMQKTGRFNGPDWDIGLNGNLPLLPVVQVLGAVKEASARSSEAELQLVLTKKNALLEIRTAYENFRAALAAKEAVEKAMKAAEENYALELEDYRMSLLNNLDVLQAIQSLQTARHDYIHAVFEVKRAYGRLLSASGETLYK